jgi:hypothetical protein
MYPNVVKEGPHYGLYCNNCATWIKWASKTERKLIEPEDGTQMLGPLTCESSRGKEWIDFSRIVLEHIEKYTVPQYGDYLDDQISNFDTCDMIVDMKWYLNRVESNSRGIQETLRDMLKVAHYACIQYYKLLEQVATSGNRTQQEG